jgi:hypothetical protein
MADFVLTDLQKVKVSVGFVDAAGNPAKVDGVPQWSSSDETILTVAAAEDGMSAEVVTVGPLGTAQVAVRADADLGEGIKEILATQGFEVVGSEAVAANFTVGTPEPR